MIGLYKTEENRTTMQYAPIAGQLPNWINDFDLWPVDLEHCCRSHGHTYTKFERNQTLRGWVIDHLVPFRTFSPPPPLWKSGRGRRNRSPYFNVFVRYNLLYTFGAGPMQSWEIQRIFPTIVKGAIMSGLVVRVGRSNYTKFGEDIGP